LEFVLWVCPSFCDRTFQSRIHKRHAIPKPTFDIPRRNIENREKGKLGFDGKMLLPREEWDEEASSNEESDQSDFSIEVFMMMSLNSTLNSVYQRDRYDVEINIKIMSYRRCSIVDMDVGFLEQQKIQRSNRV
jgi:hypothetical protein